MELVDTRPQIGVKLEDSITFKLGSPYTLNSGKSVSKHEIQDNIKHALPYPWELLSCLNSP